MNRTADDQVRAGRLFNFPMQGAGLFCWMLVGLIQLTAVDSSAQVPQFTWLSGRPLLSGTNSVITPGFYGEKGITSPKNVPIGREGAISWTDKEGGMWLFGGFVYQAGNNNQCFNDLWKYDRSAGSWTWVSGSDLVNQKGIYGIKGIGSTSNMPGARSNAASWIDQDDNLWLFGGYVDEYDPAWQPSALNDLWKYDRRSGEWTWISGSNSTLQVGNYGTKGLSSPQNVPGARWGSVSWTDSDGNLWLFGGHGYDKNQPSLDDVSTQFNDLWKFDRVSGRWTWMAGSMNAGQPSIYGIQGIPSGENSPGARSAAISWTGSDGDLWLFGGADFQFGNCGQANLSDLWKFDRSRGQWIWVGGSKSFDSIGEYGEKGEASPANYPAGRYGAISWSDTTGDLWLYGGFRNFRMAIPGDPVGGWQCTWASDLWKYDVENGMWTWMNGIDGPEQLGIYGTRGIGSETTHPGARVSPAGWTDPQGYFWMFGGSTMGTEVNVWGFYNDLWKYDLNKNEWTWMSGSDRPIGQSYVPFNNQQILTKYPAGRSYATGNTSNDHSYWLFGGDGTDQFGSNGSLNDLWKFDGITSTWTLVRSGEVARQPGVYGTKGQASIQHIPGGRHSAVSWIDHSGNFWLFGGAGTDGSGNEGPLNDLWRFEKDTKVWTWIAGSEAVEMPGIYEASGDTAKNTTPGARSNSISWTDSDGNFWLFGGLGRDKNATHGLLNDLWKFNMESRQWTWIGGSSTAGQAAVYGIRGQASVGNIPSARSHSSAWYDRSGFLWLFGGTTMDGAVNDLWKYDINTGEWTWVSGSSFPEQSSVFGSRGVSSEYNTPGARLASVTWIDEDGDLWLFGGSGKDGNGRESGLNDLWKYEVLQGKWTWVAGNQTASPGVYGFENVASPENIPGGRFGAAGWKDIAGEFYLFGGTGYDGLSTGAFFQLDDLWKIRNPKKQQITFGQLDDKVYGADPFDIDVQSSSSLPVMLESSDPSVAVIQGSRAYITGAGRTTITAFQPGDTAPAR